MKKSQKKKPGRPPAENPLLKRVIRTTDEEWRLWAEAAEVDGVKLSVFIRESVNRAARRKLR